MSWQPALGARKSAAYPGSCCPNATEAALAWMHPHTDCRKSDAPPPYSVNDLGRPQIAQVQLGDFVARKGVHAGKGIDHLGRPGRRHAVDPVPPVVGDGVGDEFRELVPAADAA